LRPKSIVGIGTGSTAGVGGLEVRVGVNVGPRCAGGGTDGGLGVRAGPASDAGGGVDGGLGMRAGGGTDGGSGEVEELAVDGRLHGGVGRGFDATGSNTAAGGEGERLLMACSPKVPKPEPRQCVVYIGRPMAFEGASPGSERRERPTERLHTMCCTKKAMFGTQKAMIFQNHDDYTINARSRTRNTMIAKNTRQAQTSRKKHAEEESSSLQ